MANFLKKICLLKNLQIDRFLHKGPSKLKENTQKSRIKLKNQEKKLKNQGKNSFFGHL